MSADQGKIPVVEQAPGAAAEPAQPPIIEQAKKLVSQNPLATIVIVILVVVVLIAMYFDFNPLTQLSSMMKKDGETFKGKKSDDTLSAIAQGY